ncbi:MAG: ABC transporter permease [Planctomycetota bacterium]|nr:MAG: ABC transporter permease [Planctomycetota bacterium]
MFARNSLIRDMTFRANFIIETISSLSWAVMNLGFYALVYNLMEHAGGRTIAGWTQHQFFVFIATTILVNSLVEALFMENAEELSELTRTGGLDFVLLKPMDPQFLVSVKKISWASLGKVLLAVALLAYSLPRIEGLQLSLLQLVLYPLYIVLGTLILYSIMIALAATSIWLGRNQSLYDFWFYLTNFSRYPMEIYSGRFGAPLRHAFTFVVPILVVINVPAAILAKPMTANNPDKLLLGAFAVAAAVGSLVISRWVFTRALMSYRSASS